MKAIKSVLVCLGLALAYLVALVFMFLELRSLLLGDFILMENAALSFLTYLFKGLYFASICALCIFIFLFRVRKKRICIVLFMMSIGLLIGAIVSLIHFVYYVSLVLIAINLILVAITSIGFFKREKEN